MRNRVRQALPFLCAILVILLILQTNIFGSLHTNTSPVTHVPVENVKAAADDALFEDDELPDILRHPAKPPAPRAAGIGHIPVQRKDLDLSGDPSEALTSSNDTQLLAYLIGKTGRNKDRAIESIIRVAHALEAYKSRDSETGGLHHVMAEEEEGDEEAAPRRKPVVQAPVAIVRPRVSDAVFRKLNTIVMSMKASHLRKPKVHNAKLDIYTDEEDNSEAEIPPWKKFHNNVGQHSLYDPADPNVQEIIDDLTNQPIKALYQHKGGTQLKLVFSFPDRSRVLFKPRRFGRDQETLPDHYYFSDYERFNAEIAAYHLDRLLEFYRVPPTVGRVVNMTSEILRFSNKKLANTFFVSPAGNLCFYGTCSYYCDTNHAICGQPDLLEGSMAAFLPSSLKAERIHWTHPWRRSYNKHHLADWRTNPDYCDEVRITPPFDSGRRLVDLSDLAIFDFFTGNLDRHHYETFEGFGNFTFVMALDNGRAFGHSDNDDLSILAPMAQCCLIRYTTLVKLLNIHRSPTSLSERMRKSMAGDKVTPILTERQLRALDRRLRIVLQTVYECIKTTPVRDVIIDDGF